MLYFQASAIYHRCISYQRLQSLSDKTLIGFIRGQMLKPPYIIKACPLLSDIEALALPNRMISYVHAYKRRHTQLSSFGFLKKFARFLYRPDNCLCLDCYLPIKSHWRFHRRLCTRESRALPGT